MQWSLFSSYVRLSGTKQKMAVFGRALLQMVAVVGVISLLTFYFMIFHNCPGELTQEVPATQKLSLSRLQPPSQLPLPGPCTCPEGSVLLKDQLPKDQYEELVKRRAKEFQQHKTRTTSALSRLLFASPNSPLQYPIQGFKVRPLTSTLIPGLALHAGQRSSYKVSLNVSKGVLTTEVPAAGVKFQGDGETRLIMESSSLVILNYLLTKVSYTSTVYHIHTGDLAHFQFEDHEAVFPITIKQPHLPVLYDMGTDISSHVTIATKTFLRYPQLNVLLSSIRRFYSNIEVVIADDSLKPEHVTGEHIRQYFMPPAQGWFAGRNLAVSQVTTKYFLWVDDDFLFTEQTKIEKLVEVMEAVPELDVLGGTVQGNQFYFSLIYDEGEEMDGGCLHRKSNGKFHSLPSYPQCFLASGVVNFFLARTDAVQRVGFDPKLQRVAHSEFFMDGLGSLMVATCNHVSIGHQPKTGHNKDEASYSKFRHPAKTDTEFKLRLHFFKNHLKCVRYG
ncbi:beta-1,4 N-acetylgalactosaminyltransferase 2-like isoform X1 [Sebastes umbrosus]|uniref:beta-1,4 N-acetylgalactosaminyltransferase 2-like isoform X1 n=2 Tax=Sebastes umbrosus TaxID=72105 RepID=UPI00189E910C|nr:beta-1,4 N-acetylgalactosaminyltransferase 2-like isoform X1 [Sebastes umbrosus]